MTLVDVFWTPKVNMLVVKCDCGRTFEHRLDCWTVRCKCGRAENIEVIRCQPLPRKEKLDEHAG